MTRVAVLNVVGLTQSLIGEHTPRIRAHAEKRHLSTFPPAFPAVTTTAQSTYVTGKEPTEHGAVANGWYDREAAEVKFWKQSNHLVKGDKIWDVLRAEDPDFTCAKMFWWYNMYSNADFSATPRPLYLSDGKKVFDIHTHPMEMREELKAKLGDFPFPSFWGPRAGIESSRWIAESAKWIEEKQSPTLNLVYLPHLDYCLQKDGPEADSIPAELHAIDEIVGELLDFFEGCGVEVILLSEYGISPVRKVVHLNREFRSKGWIQVKDELGHETLDCGTCRAFAVADHQVAHIYVNDPSILRDVRDLLESIDGVDEVREGADWTGVGRERAGDLIAVADPDAWFSYYYWEDDVCAPEYARCIDIHRKPGYDPAELFIDPEIKFPLLKIAGFLIRKKFGFRAKMDVIPLDASLVKGSHGRDKVPESEQPVYIGSEKVAAAVDVAEAIMDEVRGVKA